MILMLRCIKPNSILELTLLYKHRRGDQLIETSEQEQLEGQRSREALHVFSGNLPFKQNPAVGSSPNSLLVWLADF